MNKIIHYNERTLLFRQLALMEKSSLPLDKAINLISTWTSDKQLKPALVDIAQKLASGITLSQALTSHPDIFSEQEIEMVSLGEQSSNLPQTLKLLARSQEFNAKQKLLKRSNLQYPVFLLIILFILVAFMIFLRN